VTQARQLGDPHILGIALDALAYITSDSDPERARSNVRDRERLGRGGRPPCDRGLLESYERELAMAEREPRALPQSRKPAALEIWKP
jgi:hypothetical protein